MKAEVNQATVSDNALKTFVFCTLNHFLLQVTIHIIEIVAVPSHSYQQVLVIVGTLLGGIEGCRINDIKLDMMATEGEIAADKLAQFLDILLPFEQTW